MANTINNGMTVSAKNTPQAVDDYASTTEDSGIVINVLGNDRGGNAKSLYSISQAAPTNVVTVAHSALGATIYITADGQVYYDPTGASALQALAQGEIATDTFVYEERLGNGAISVATVHVTVTGTNDAPTIVAASTVASGAITEHVGATGSGAADSASGSVAFADTDLHDTHSLAQSGPTFVWSGGTLSADQQQALAAAGTLALIEHDSTGTGA